MVLRVLPSSDLDQGFSDNRALPDNKSLPHAQLRRLFHMRIANLLPTTLKSSGRRKKTLITVK